MPYANVTPVRFFYDTLTLKIKLSGSSIRALSNIHKSLQYQQVRMCTVMYFTPN